MLYFDEAQWLKRTITLDSRDTSEDELIGTNSWDQTIESQYKQKKLAKQIFMSNLEFWRTYLISTRVFASDVLIWYHLDGTSSFLETIQLLFS